MKRSSLILAMFLTLTACGSLPFFPDSATTLQGKLYQAEQSLLAAYNVANQSCAIGFMSADELATTAGLLETALKTTNIAVSAMNAGDLTTAEGQRQALLLVLTQLNQAAVTDIRSRSRMRMGVAEAQTVYLLTSAFIELLQAAQQGDPDAKTLVDLNEIQQQITVANQTWLDCVGSPSG